MADDFIQFNDQVGTQYKPHGFDRTGGIIQPATAIGPCAAPGAGIATVKSSTPEGYKLIKSGAGNCYKASVGIIGLAPGTYWLLWLDQITTPVNGVVTPIWFVSVECDGTNGFGGDSWIPGPMLPFTLGLTLALSSAATPLTLALANGLFQAQAA